MAWPGKSIPCGLHFLAQIHRKTEALCQHIKAIGVAFFGKVACKLFKLGALVSQFAQFQSKNARRLLRISLGLPSPPAASYQHIRAIASCRHIKHTAPPPVKRCVFPLHTDQPPRLFHGRRRPAHERERRKVAQAASPMLATLNRNGRAILLDAGASCLFSFWFMSPHASCMQQG